MTDVSTTCAEAIFRVNTNNSPSQDSDSSHPDDHFQWRYFNPGCKPFSYSLFYAFTNLLGQHVCLLSCDFEFASNLWRAFFKVFFYLRPSFKLLSKLVNVNGKLPWIAFELWQSLLYEKKHIFYYTYIYWSALWEFPPLRRAVAPQVKNYDNFSRVFEIANQLPTCLSLYLALLGSLSKHDGDGSENVIWKCNFPFLQSIFRELKRRRRQQKPHKFAYLTMENSIFARFARAFFIFWHFEDVLVLSTTWNDLFCSCVDDVSIWWQMFNFVFLYPKRLFQFNSRTVRTHFSSITTLNN